MQAFTSALGLWITLKGFELLNNDQHISTEGCLVCDALKNSVHFLENGDVYVLFYQYILE